MQVAATTTMARMLAKACKDKGLNYQVRYITCNAEQYSRYVGSIYEAEDYGDWNCNTNKFRAIEVVYPDDYYAMPRYITTKEIVYLRADTQPKNAEELVARLAEAVEI